MRMGDIFPVSKARLHAKHCRSSVRRSGMQQSKFYSPSKPYWFCLPACEPVQWFRVYRSSHIAALVLVVSLQCLILISLHRFISNNLDSIGT